MIVIYHNRDLDGFASGAICKRKYPEAKLIGYDYGQPLEIEITGEPILMVDVSVPMTTMLKLAELSSFQFTWIDHHISAIKDYNNFLVEDEKRYGHFLTPVLDDKISACEGAWKYLFPDESMPEAILLLGEYDTWRNQDKERWENIILPFQYGMRQICSSPETFPAFLFGGIAPDGFRVDVPFGFDVESIIDRGKSILAYQQEINALNCKKNAFEAQFEGLRAICLNGGPFNSGTFDSVYDPEKHDIIMPFQFNGKFWTVSIYTTKDIDCSEIAKKWGGGGHRKAAGLQVTDITKVFPQAIA